MSETVHASSTYYPAVQAAIRQHYNKYTGDQNSFAVSVLLLIDHRPVIRWIQGIPHYAYVVVSDSNLTVVYKRKSNTRVSKDVRAIPNHYRDTTLEVFLQRFENNLHVAEWALIEGLSYTTQDMQKNEIVFDSSLKDLGAISLFTSEYKLIQQIVNDKGLTGTRGICGLTFSNPLTSKFFGIKSFTGWLTSMYYDYMIVTNLQLMEYYVRNYRRLKATADHSAVYNFTEFVPCMMQYSEVYNPMNHPQLVNAMRTAFPEWMGEMLTMTENLSINGSRVRFDRSEEIVAFYTTRASVEKITRFSAAPDAGPLKRNVYSPKFFSGMVLNALFSDSNTEVKVEPMMYSNKIQWNCIILDDRIIGFTAQPANVPANVRVFECSFGIMLFIQMLSEVYGFENFSTIEKFLVTYHEVTINDIKKAGILNEPV